MKGNERAVAWLNELKAEVKNVTALLNETRDVHSSTWMKKVRLELGKLRKLPETVPISVQAESLLAKLAETLDAVNAAMKISSSDKLVKVHKYVLKVLTRFSDRIPTY